MTKTHQVIKDSREEFEKLANDTIGYGNKVFFPFGGDNHDFNQENCLAHITHTLISVLEARIEDREGRKKEERIGNRTGRGAKSVKAVIKNQALEEETKADRELINSIKE